jgi:hypothetical protein
LSGYSLQHLANASILALFPVQTELFPCLHLVYLLWPTQQHVVCPNNSYFTCTTPPFTTGGLNTFTQVNIMDVRYTMYNGHIYRSQLFFLCFYLFPGRPAGPRLSCQEHTRNLGICKEAVLSLSKKLS